MKLTAPRSEDVIKQTMPMIQTVCPVEAMSASGV
jgi:hypothetical protein